MTCTNLCRHAPIVILNCGKSGTTLREVSRPRVDGHRLKVENSRGAGELSGAASKNIMKILYGARTCRWDLQQSRKSLARAK